MNVQSDVPHLQERIRQPSIPSLPIRPCGCQGGAPHPGPTPLTPPTPAPSLTRPLTQPLRAAAHARPMRMRMSMAHHMPWPRMCSTTHFPSCCCWRTACICCCCTSRRGPATTSLCLLPCSPQRLLLLGLLELGGQGDGCRVLAAAHAATKGPGHGSGGGGEGGWAGSDHTHHVGECGCRGKGGTPNREAARVAARMRRQQHC